MKYKYSVLGGSFDHFHRGHKAFLDAAFEQSEYVMIGLATEKLLEKKQFSYSLQNLETRKKELENYLAEKNYLGRAEIIPIDDIYGNTLSQEKIDALFATGEVLQNAEKINSERKKLGFNPLEIVLVEPILADDSIPISSTRIRSGEIDRDGNSYLKLFKQDLKLPDSLREELKKPFGEIINNLKIGSSNFIIAIGDVTTIELLEQNIKPNICLFDLKTKREPINEVLKNKLPKVNQTVKNHAGMIATAAVEVLFDAIKNNLENESSFAVEIDGEEDLLALPAILLAPLEATVYYGLADVGAVEVLVTEEMKEEIKGVLKKFEKV